MAQRKLETIQDLYEWIDGVNSVHSGYEDKHIDKSPSQFPCVVVYNWNQDGYGSILTYEFVYL